MRKKLLGFLAILISLSVVYSNTPIRALALEEQNEDQTLYIASQSNVSKVEVPQQINGLDITEESTIDSRLSSYDNIIVDADRLGDELNTSLITAFDDQSRIFVLGDISVNSVRSYFGLDEIPEDISEAMHEVNSAAEIDPLCNSVDVSAFEVLGVLIYRDISGSNVTQVRIEDSANDNLVATALQYCFAHDYLALATRSGDNAVSTMSYTNSWTNVDVNTETYVTTRCTISTSIKLDKNSGNPNSNGEYLQYTPYVVEVEVNSGSTIYSIRKVEVTVKGSSSSTIYDYGPLDQSCGASASVSFGLPYSINVSFNPGSKVAISKISGGIDSNSVKICYQPKTVIGLDGYEYDGIRCEAHIEAYQANSGYLYGYGQYGVYTYEHDSYSGDAINYLKYYNSTWDTVSGS